MGTTSSRHDRWDFRLHHGGVLLCGLEGSGKTCILHRLKHGSFVPTMATSGFNVETVPLETLGTDGRRSQYLDVLIWDVGGAPNMRPLWVHYYYGRTAVAWCVDATSAPADLELSARELDWVLRGLGPTLPLLVLATHALEDGAVGTPVVTKALGLASSPQTARRSWHVQACQGPTGEGLREGFTWLANAVRALPTVPEPRAPPPERGDLDPARHVSTRVAPSAGAGAAAMAAAGARRDSLPGGGAGTSGGGGGGGGGGAKGSVRFANDGSVLPPDDDDTGDAAAGAGADGPARCTLCGVTVPERSKLMGHLRVAHKDALSMSGRNLLAVGVGGAKPS